jgi:histidinol-phosphate/aromatic aminotransferase/cobyric acid decarboxylase-like protein
LPRFLRRRPVKVSRGQPGTPDYISVEASDSDDAEELLDKLVPQPPVAPTVIEIGAPGTDGYIRISAADSDEAQTLLEQVNETLQTRSICRSVKADR